MIRSPTRRCQPPDVAADLGFPVVVGTGVDPVTFRFSVVRNGVRHRSPLFIWAGQGEGLYVDEPCRSNANCNHNCNHDRADGTAVSVRQIDAMSPVSTPLSVRPKPDWAASPRFLRGNPTRSR